MQMTMMGVVLTIVLSGMVSLFISQKFLRRRVGLGLMVMFFVPTLSCATYIILTAPRFNPPAKELVVASSPIEVEDFEALRDYAAQNPTDPNAIIDLASAYIRIEDYDSAIAMLKNKWLLFPASDMALSLSTAYFAKGLLMAEQGNYEAALFELRNAQDVAPKEAAFLPDLEYFIKLISEQIAEQDQADPDQ
jgi:tetratricopeptide (TPR) repeat protein